MREMNLDEHETLELLKLLNSDGQAERLEELNLGGYYENSTYITADGATELFDSILLKANNLKSL